MLTPEQYYTRKIVPKLIQGVPTAEAQDITRILRRSPAVKSFVEGNPRLISYNALIQNLGTGSWCTAMKLYNYFFFSKDPDYPKITIPKPNLQTARVVLGVLTRSANWQLATRHFLKYCFDRFPQAEATYNLGKMYTYLHEQRVSEMAYRLLENVERQDLKYTEELRNTLFRTDLATWNANLRILSVLYKNNKKLIENDQIHQVLSLCVRSLQWKKCMQVLTLSEELNVKVSSSLLLRVAKLFFKGNRWSLSSHILTTYRVKASAESDYHLNPVERRDKASMLALARMWLSALQLVQKQTVEEITSILAMAGAWECSMQYCWSLPCMQSTDKSVEERILDIPWKVVQNCILAGKYAQSARESSIRLLKPFIDKTPSVECWKLALQIANANYVDLIQRLPVESQLLDMKFYPVTYHIHPAHRFKVLFPVVLNYLEETEVITKEDRKLFERTYTDRSHESRWLFAFQILETLTSQPDKAPVHRPTFNQLVVTLSHLTNIPYLTVLKGHIDAIKLNRSVQSIYPESMLKSFVYGGFLDKAVDLIDILRAQNLTIGVECLIFAVSTMVLPGVSNGKVQSQPDIEKISIPVNIRNDFDRKMLNDYIKMYRFADLLSISSTHKSMFMSSQRFPFLITVDLNLTSVLTLQKRSPCEHPDVLVLYNSPQSAVILKPPKLESIAHAASKSPQGTCPDVTSAIRFLFPETENVRSYGLTHRLDIQTSGVLIVAKSQPGFHHITQQSLTKQKRKSYLCVCIQIDPEKHFADSGTISTGFSDMRDDSHRMNLEGDAEAETHYTTLKKFQCGIRIIECRLVTGRQHQIRVHLGRLGLLLLGDDRYGCGLAASPLIDRVALHAKEIGFWEPSGDGFCMVEATPPQDLARAIKKVEQMELLV